MKPSKPNNDDVMDYINTKSNNTTNVLPSITEIEGLCTILNIGKNTAYSLLADGEIESFKIGSVYKIPLKSINDYIERKVRQSKLQKMYTLINPNRDLYFEKYGQIPIMTK